MGSVTVVPAGAASLRRRSTDRSPLTDGRRQGRARDEGLRGRRHGRRRREPRDRRRRVHGARRPLGVREDDAAADDRRARAGLERAGHPRRRGRHGPFAARARHGDGLPELRPVPAHDRRREPRLRAQAAQDLEGGARPARLRTSRRSSVSRSSSTASPASSRAASASASRWAGRWCASRRRS